MSKQPNSIQNLGHVETVIPEARVFSLFCQRQNFLSLTMIQPPVVSSVVVVVVVVGVIVQIKNGITFERFEISA